MINFLKKLFFLTLILFVISSDFLTNKVNAQAAEFVHFIKANYEILDSKTTKVEYAFTTTNKIANNYLQTFSFRVPFEPINIKTDGSRTGIKVNPVKKISKDIYSLEVEILNPVYGLNKKFDWKFSFEVTNLIFDHANQKAIVIPNFNDEPNISNAEVNVRIPNSLGEIKYIYGNANSKIEGSSTLLNYLKQDNKSSSFIVLIGNDQEYAFEVKNIKKETKIYLPEINPYQYVLYKSFPTRNVGLSEKKDKLFPIKENETISGIIKTTVNPDLSYSKESDELKNNEITNKIIELLKKENLQKEAVPRRVFEILNTEFEVMDYNTTEQSTVDLSKAKKELNTAELNKVFREVLSSYDIENRGIFGYVFPIQPFTRENYVSTQHVWSEFWDGKKWVVVDPSWYLASKGTDYFDKNSFHHLKFGNYHEISEIKNFLINKELMELIPLKEINTVSKEEKLEMAAYDNAFLNKEFKLVLTNNSNIPIKVKSLNTNLETRKIKLDKIDTDVNEFIFPNEKMEIVLPLKYGLIFKNIKTNLDMNVTYYDFSNSEKNKTFTHAMNIKTNFSGYLIQGVLGLFLTLIVLFPLAALIKKRAG